MAVSMAQARRLCTQAELELVEASRPQHMKELTPARLKQKITRARSLRDKYRDLSKRQRLEARGKKRPQGGRPAQGNENTRRKAELFGEILARFRSGLDKVEGRAAKSAGRPGASEAADTRSKAAQGADARKSAPSRAAAKKGAKKRPRKAASTAREAAKKAASGGAQAREMAEPRSPGASAMKGARRRTAGSGRADGSNRGTDRSRAAHTRSAGRRSQSKRDRR